MEFGNIPLLVFVPLAAGAVLLLQWQATRARQRTLAGFHSHTSRFAGAILNRRRAAWFLAAAVALIAAAVAEPLGGYEEGTASREGRDVLVVLDVSLSMYARDHGGATRAEAAREAVEQLVDLLAAAGGHRLSLLAFAGRATLLLPPALDYETFRLRHRQVGPHDISRRGTRLDTGLAAALGSIDAGDEEFTDVVLVSDGEDHGTALRLASRGLRSTGVAVHAFAMGRPSAEVPITIPTADGLEAPLLYQGQPVRSKADHASMRDLAAFGGGAFCAVVEAGCIREVFDAIDSGPTRSFVTEGRERRRRPLYPWLVVPALALLLGGALTGRVRP